MSEGPKAFGLRNCGSAEGVAKVRPGTSLGIDAVPRSPPHVVPCGPALAAARELAHFTPHSTMNFSNRAALGAQTFRGYPEM